MLSLLHPAPRTRMLAERSPVHCCVRRSRMSGAAHALCATDPALICPGMMHQTMMPSYKIFCTHWDSKHSGACPTEEDIQVRVDMLARAFAYRGCAPFSFATDTHSTVLDTHTGQGLTGNPFLRKRNPRGRGLRGPSFQPCLDPDLSYTLISCHAPSRGDVRRSGKEP